MQIIFVHFLFPVQNIALLCSIYTTVVLAVQRYLAISKPLEYYIDGATATAGEIKIRDFQLAHSTDACSSSQMKRNEASPDATWETQTYRPMINEPPASSYLRYSSALCSSDLDQINVL